MQTAFIRQLQRAPCQRECSISDTPTLLFPQTYKVYHLWSLLLFAYAAAPAESAAEIVKDGDGLISRHTAACFFLLF